MGHTYLLDDLKVDAVEELDVDIETVRNIHAPSI